MVKYKKTEKWLSRYQYIFLLRKYFNSDLEGFLSLIEDGKILGFLDEECNVVCDNIKYAHEKKFVENVIYGSDIYRFVELEHTVMKLQNEDKYKEYCGYLREGERGCFGEMSSLEDNVLTTKMRYFLENKVKINYENAYRLTFFKKCHGYPNIHFESYMGLFSEILEIKNEAGVQTKQDSAFSQERIDYVRETLENIFQVEEKKLLRFRDICIGNRGLEKMKSEEVTMNSVVSVQEELPQLFSSFTLEQIKGNDLQL